MFKVNIKDTSTKPFASFCYLIIVNFEHISQLLLVFLLLIVSRLMPAGYIMDESS